MGCNKPVNSNLQESGRTISVYLSLFCFGYVASLFLTYSFIVMPGLAGLDDKTFVAAFQGLETRFQNASGIPGYKPYGYGNIPAMIAFPGAILFSSVAAIISWKTVGFKWIVAALVLFLAGFATTKLYNLPSNLEIFAAGDPNKIDVAKVRENFDEVAWLYLNHFRAMTASLGTFFLAWTLHLQFRSR